MFSMHLFLSFTHSFPFFLSAQIRSPEDSSGGEELEGGIEESQALDESTEQETELWLQRLESAEDEQEAGAVAVPHARVASVRDEYQKEWLEHSPVELGFRFPTLEELQEKQSGLAVYSSPAAEAAEASSPPSGGRFRAPGLWSSGGSKEAVAAGIPVHPGLANVATAASAGGWRVHHAGRNRDHRLNGVRDGASGSNNVWIPLWKVRRLLSEQDFRSLLYCLVTGRQVIFRTNSMTQGLRFVELFKVCGISLPSSLQVQQGVGWCSVFVMCTFFLCELMYQSSTLAA